ncbi:MAG: GNAT family N-acetyltransferase [Christensenellales bacterium]|jgi:hypothetical protein
MTNADILDIAMRQSAVDSNCLAEDFTARENKIVLSKQNPGARQYLELPFLCDLTSYGSNIVASVSPEFEDITREYIGKYPVEHCFETPSIHALTDKLLPLGASVCFMAEYFLPDIGALKALDCPYQLRLLQPEDLSPFYLPRWKNALSMERRELDMLAYGAFDGGDLIGLAGCSADCGSMWQIGIDVLEGHRGRGVASCLTSRLALELLGREIAPFYCCAWSNLGSVRNAIKSGFRPAWVQLTVKKIDFIEKMNR